MSLNVLPADVPMLPRLGGALEDYQSGAFAARNLTSFVIADRGVVDNARFSNIVQGGLF